MGAKGQRKSGGRKKGTPNKINGMVKAQILEALEAEGGVEWLRGLARENKPAFAQLLGRLVPSEIKAEVESSGEPLLILRDYTGLTVAEKADLVPVNRRLPNHE